MRCAADHSCSRNSAGNFGLVHTAVSGAMPCISCKGVSDGWQVAAALLLPQMDALSVDIEQLTVENAALSEVRWVRVNASMQCSMLKRVHHLQTASSAAHAQPPLLHMDSLTTNAADTHAQPPRRWRRRARCRVPGRAARRAPWRSRSGSRYSMIALSHVDV
jgi:hypothetical protein